MSHDELKSLIAPYVLGATSAEETEYVRAHIVACDECMAEADSYSTVVSSLALSVEDEPLPDGFIDRVMTRAHSESGESAALTAVAPAEPAAGATVSSSEQPARVVRTRRRASILAAAAALLVVVVLAGSLILTRSELTDTRGELAREREQLAALIEQQGGMRLHSASGEAAGAMLPTDEGGVLLVQGLEDAPGDQTYQVWLIDDNEPASAGTFEPSGGVSTLVIDASLEGIDSVAVTVEPAGGSASPTGDPILESEA